MKINTPTPHNNAKFGEIAKTVLMPGDPLRAKYIAQKYLEDAKLYNDVRGMLGYTGKYKGVTISVQGSGMGVPSMGIYSKRAFEGYDVDNIIRIGSAGSLDNDNASDISKSVNLGDIVVASDVITDSNYINANHYNVEPVASEKLLNILKDRSKGKDNIKIGTVYTSDTFYMENYLLEEMSKKDVMGVEMETLALYTNAKVANKNALSMFTVTDKLLRGISVGANERQNGLNEMIELALDVAVQLEKERIDGKVEKFNFNIKNFEGPLDLLLYLISKNKKDIFDISLSELTDEYIQYLNEMNEKNIEVASEFVVMASTLLDIKARKLLPQLEEPEDEEVISEEELLRQISQYKLYKEASEKINKMYLEHFGSFIKGVEKIDFVKNTEYKGEKLDKQDIFSIYSDILFRNQNKVNKHAKEIEKIAIYEKYTVQDKVKQIVNYLNENKSMVFNSVFPNTCDNIEIVTAFLGVLELGKLRQVDIDQKYLFSDINVTRKNDNIIDIDSSRFNY